MSYFTKHLILSLFCLTALLLVVPISSDAAGYSGYKITTSIPGTNIVAGKSASEFTIAVYVATLYKGALALVGFVALVMIVFWGFSYVFSGGNASKTADARDGIFQAIIGIILLLAGYLILNFANPALVNIEELNKRLNNEPVITNTGSQTGGGNTSTVVPCGSNACATGSVCVNMSQGPICQNPNALDYSYGNVCLKCSNIVNGSYNTLDKCKSVCTGGTCSVASGLACN